MSSWRMKPVVGRLPVREQVEHGADRGGGGDLDGAHGAALHLAAVDLVGIGLLHQLAVDAAADGDEDDHHVLQRRRHGVLQDVLEHVAAVAQPQVVEQRLHDRRVAGIADGAVVEVADLAFEGVAQRAEPAGGVERLVGDAVERELLLLLQRRHLAAGSVHDRLARLAVFVDDAVGAPGQVVVERVRGILRQRADPQLDAVERLEALRHVEGDDGDEARREAALRDEGHGRVGGQRHDLARAGDILGEVEVVRPRRPRRLRDHRRQVEGRGIEHRELAVEKLDQLEAVVDVGCDRLNAFVVIATGQHLGRAIDQRHMVVAGRGQQLSDRGADLAGTDHDDVFHAPSVPVARSPRRRTMTRYGRSGQAFVSGRHLSRRTRRRPDSGSNTAGATVRRDPPRRR